MKNYTTEQLQKIAENCPRLYPGFLLGQGFRYQVIKSWETALENGWIQEVLEKAENWIAAREFSSEDMCLYALGEAADMAWDGMDLLYYEECPDCDIYGADPRIFEQEEDGAWLEDGEWHDNPDGSQVVFCVGDNGTYIAPFVETDDLVAYEPEEDWEPDIHPAAYAVIK